jgi:two-component system, chemotaxis family, protein-glutamate methylesterase/glutaminase
MANILLVSPSAFLRIGLLQQLRRRNHRLVPLESSDAGQALRLLADSRIDLAIVDDTLLTGSDGDLLIDALRRYTRRALLIGLQEPHDVPARVAHGIPIIAGRTDGVLDMGGIARTLHDTLDALAGTKPTWQPTDRPEIPAAAPRQPAGSAEIILIAASTGGPGALATLLTRLGPPPVPVVVAQHMPEDQTESFARHLAVETGLAVRECGVGQMPEAHVAVLRGGADYRMRRAANAGFWLSTANVAGNAFHPSADLLFASAAEAGIRSIAVVLSGMGEDGARGASLIAAQGGGVLVQDFASCVVPGMPAAARAACPSALVASLPQIAARLSRWTARSHRSFAAVAEES